MAPQRSDEYEEGYARGRSGEEYSESLGDNLNPFRYRDSEGMREKAEGFRHGQEDRRNDRDRDCK